MKIRSEKMKQLFWGILVGWFLILPLSSAQANQCVCHNLEHNPHTICVGDAGFKAHLYGHLNIGHDTVGPCCGNDECEMSDGEDCSTCSKDCGVCPPKCGDGQCNGGETCDSCSADCGECCGDGTCDGDGGEDCNTCPDDCDSCPAVCNNNVFEEGFEECDVVNGQTQGCPADTLCNTNDNLCVCMICGNGIVAEGEDCEFDSSGNELNENACPTGESCGEPGTMDACLCVPDGSVPNPNCGNSVLNDGEECDGSIDAACDGRACLANCQCQEDSGQVPPPSSGPGSIQGSGDPVGSCSLSRVSTTSQGLVLLLGIASMTVGLMRMQLAKKRK